MAVAVRGGAARRDRGAFREQAARETENLEWSDVAGRDPVFAGDRFGACYFEADFASFLAWRDWGFPDRGVFNGFGMGALRGSDGAFVLGEMGQHTANAGRIYFPSGTPDLDDLSDGAVDIAGSVAREVEEETGLTPADYRAAAHWDCVVAGAAIAMIRMLNVEVTGEALRAQDRGQSRPAGIAGTFRDPSGARLGDLTAGDAALRHGVHRRAVRRPMSRLASVGVRACTVLRQRTGALPVMRPRSLRISRRPAEALHRAVPLRRIGRFHLKSHKTE